MKKYNSINERIKHAYCQYLSEADGKSESTIEGVRKALLRFEEYNKLKNFSTFNPEQAIGFKKHLEKKKAERSGQPLSKSTVLSTLNHLKSFFKWLAQQPGYKSKIHIPDISYLSLTDKEVRAAKAQKIKNYPTLEQIYRVIFAMSQGDEVARRNQAIIAFTILTGIRAHALISLKLKHVHLDRNLIEQDPREVRTKFSKKINTYFFPMGEMGEDIRKIFVEWVDYLINEKLYGYEAPLFPRTRLEHDQDLSFKVSGLEPEHWTTTSPLRKIFKETFAQVGLPYYNPHSFRDTVVHLMAKQCKNVEELQACSLNLGHENPAITFASYGNMDSHTQGEVMKSLGKG